MNRTLSSAAVALLCASGCGDPRPAVTGILVDGLTGEPAAGVQIRLREVPPATGYDGYGSTDAQGRFTLVVSDAGEPTRRFAGFAANRDAAGSWTEPPQIDVQVPSRWSDGIELAQGERLDIGILVAMDWREATRAYAGTCGAWEAGAGVEPPTLSLELVVLQRHSFDEDFRAAPDVLRAMGGWRPESPTLVCVSTGSRYAGVYVEEGDVPPPLVDPLQEFRPDAARSLEAAVVVFDARGVAETRISIAPPETTVDLDTTEHQLTRLAEALTAWLRSR
jgi:hypothetical protein